MRLDMQSLLVPLPPGQINTPTSGGIYGTHSVLAVRFCAMPIGGFIRIHDSAGRPSFTVGRWDSLLRHFEVSPSPVPNNPVSGDVPHALSKEKVKTMMRATRRGRMTRRRR